MTTRYDNYETAAQKIIDHVGKNIFLAVPLGLGKPIGLLNALYRLASADKTIQLTIITGLTLARPLLHNELEKRLVEPILARLLKDYEDPLYEHARELQQLPSNINVIEFFLSPAKYLHNNYVQQNYISSKYTSVVHDAFRYPINVYAQQVAHSSVNPEEYSLSCNTDLFHEAIQRLIEFKTNNNRAIAIVAEVNANLPFMPGDIAIVNSNVFTDIVDTGAYRALFAMPHDEISPPEHLIGLYTSRLIKDDGCLEIGIGKLSNAVANALIMRHKQNNIYQDVFKQLAFNEKFGESIASIGDLSVFDKGLYASTEMISDEYIELYKTGILKKRVYDHVGLQQLLNQNTITENITSTIIDILLEDKLINSKLTAVDVQFLQKFGIFKSDITYQADNLILSTGEIIPADLRLPQVKQKIITTCLGQNLKSGKIAHVAFFLGTNNLYQYLRDLPPEKLQLFEMSTIARTNTVLWSYELSQLQRRQARFVNTAMMVTLGGALVSDGLKNLQEISGVGGQFDFVNMAQNLHNARSIITLRSTNKIKHRLKSNIVWDYPNITIARYLRDIVVTEYGIADCRSEVDAEVIKSILNITDSRFQQKLLTTAKKFGKLPQDYEIPKCFQQNYPSTVEKIIHDLQLKGYCKPYPFGSDLTDEEQVLAHALLFLKNCTKFKLFVLIISSLFFIKNDKKFNPYLVRMKLDHPKNFKDFIYMKLLKYIIAKN